MIKAQFTCDGEARFFAVTVKGHAGYAPHGQDIVCAAVSALAQSLPFGFARAGVEVRTTVDQKGSFALHASAHTAQALRDTDILLGAFYDALSDIESQYKTCIQVSMQRR